MFFVEKLETKSRMEKKMKSTVLSPREVTDNCSVLVQLLLPFTVLLLGEPFPQLFRDAVNSL